MYIISIDFHKITLHASQYYSVLKYILTYYFWLFTAFSLPSGLHKTHEVRQKKPLVGILGTHLALSSKHPHTVSKTVLYHVIKLLPIIIFVSQFYVIAFFFGLRLRAFETTMLSLTEA